MKTEQTSYKKCQCPNCDERSLFEISSKDSYKIFTCDQCFNEYRYKELLDFVINKRKMRSEDRIHKRKLKAPCCYNCGQTCMALCIEPMENLISSICNVWSPASFFEKDYIAWLEKRESKSKENNK